MSCFKSNSKIPTGKRRSNHDQDPEELSKVEFLPVGLDLDANLENSMIKNGNRTGSEQDLDGDEYVTADEDDEFDLIVSISNVEEAELV